MRIDENIIMYKTYSNVFVLEIYTQSEAIAFVTTSECPQV